MHPVRIVAVACLLGGCELLLPVVQDSADGGGSEIDVLPPIDAVSDVATDAGADAAEERVQDNNTIFCGPELECSHANPNTGCCVSTADSGSPPDSYVFVCEDKGLCTSDSGSTPLIACDQGTDCPGAEEVCCWANALDPIHTFCFGAEAGNCALELCDPNDQPPCVNHAGYQCVATGLNVPSGKTTPLGYFVCVP